MTISSSTESQAIAARSQSQTADAKPNQKASAEKTSTVTAETPAVVVETASQSAPLSAATTSGPVIETAEQALNAAKAIGAALAEQGSSIANGATNQVAGLLSEFEVAAGSSV